MNVNLIFDILGIEKTTDETIIKNAYRMKLAQTNPEDKPEEFKQLRTAYEEGLEYARNGGEAKDGDVMVTAAGFGNSPAGEWLNKVSEVYTSLSRRLNDEEWKALLEEDVCTDLDYTEEIKQGLFRYIMDHFQMNGSVYRLLDEKFGIVENEAELKENFSVEFVDYMIHKVKDVKNDTDFAYEWLEGEDTADYDGFVDRLYSLERLTIEEKIDEAKTVVKEMEALRIYHPFFDVEKMRLELEIQKKSGGYKENQDMKDKIRDLLERYPTSIRIPLLGAEILWKCGEHEKSAEIYKGLVGRYEDYLIDKYLAFYEYEQGNKSEAEKHANKSLEMQRDEEVTAFRDKVASEIIEEYHQKKPENEEEAEKYIRACINTNKYDEAYDFLTQSDFADKMADGYGYLAHCCLPKQMWEETVRFAKAWREKLGEKRKELEQEKDGKEEKEREELDERLKRNYVKFGQSYVYEAKAWYSQATELGKDEKDRHDDCMEQSVTAIEKALALSEVDGEKDYSNRLLYTDILMEAGRYEEAKVQADEILAVYPRFFILIVKKQKICFELRQAQEVVDLFYQGQELFYNIRESQGFETVRDEVPKLYELAAEVFSIFRQYEDVENILRQAKEADITSPKLQILSVRLQRVNSRTDVEIFEACKEAEKTLDGLGKIDNELLSELYYEMSLLENAQYYQPYIKQGKDLEYIEQAIELCPKPEYYYLHGCILMDYRKYEEALKEFEIMEKTTGKDEAVCFNMARCHRALGHAQEAIALLKDVIELNPEHDRAHGELSDIYSALMRRNSSREYGKLALEQVNKQIEITMSGENPNLYYFLDRGCIYQALEQYEEALADAETALEMEKKNCYAFEQKAKALAGLKQYQKAVFFMAKAIASLDNPRAELGFYITIGEMCERMSDLKRAEEWYKRGLELAGDDERSQFYDSLGSLYAKMGNSNLAKEMMTKCFHAGGYRGEKWRLDYDLLRVDYMAFKGKKLQAFDYIRRINMLAQASHQNADILDEQGDIYLYFGNNREKAKKAWIHLIDMCKNDRNDIWKNKQTLLYLMKLYHEDGNREKVEEYGRYFEWAFCGYFGVDTLDEAAVKCEEVLYNSITRFYDLGLYWLCMGDMERAWKYCRMMEGRNLCSYCLLGGCTDYYELLGLLLEEEKKTQQAIDAYKKACEYDGRNQYTLWKLRSFGELSS